MSKNKQYESIDQFKLIAALLVVAIHTSPLLSFNALGDFVLTRMIARIAVPFFLMVTGYFTLADALSKSVTNQQKAKRNNDLPRFFKKTLLLYLFAVILYLPVNLYAGQFHNADFFSVLRMLLFDGTFYHLWYLPALLLAMALILALCKRLSFRAITGICLILYLIGLFGDSYYGLIKQVPVISDFYNFLFQMFSYTRNGLFFAPIFLIMGARLRCPSEHWNYFMQNKRAALGVGFFISLTCMIMEGLTLHYFKAQRHDSMYVMLPPCMIFLFSLLLSVKTNKTNKSSFQCLRRVSIGVYILHPLMIVIVRMAAKFTHLEKLLIDNSLLHYAAVCLLSAAVSLFAGRLFALLSRKRQTPRSRRGIWPAAHHEPLQKERAWIEINQKNLCHNIEALRTKLPGGCQLMAAVKANAYGHGAILISKLLNFVGVTAFCVADVMEGAQLRQNGIKGEILILGYTHPKHFYLLNKYHLTQTVINYDYAQTLNQYGRKIKTHVKIDTGMHRLGERFEQIEEIYEIFQLENLDIEGIYTHLCADETKNPTDKAYTLAQKKAFFDVILQLKKRGVSCAKVHLLASYGLLNYPELAGNYARIGIALYGCLSNREDKENCELDLMPILSLKARVSLVKNLYQGESAGYNMQYTANQDKKIAVLTIGYADGLPRALSCGVGHVLLHGRRAPIIGRICMDQTIIDVTDIPTVKTGDIAVIIGKSENQEITAYDLAEQTDSITNEIFSRLGSRLGRIIV